MTTDYLASDTVSEVPTKEERELVEDLILQNQTLDALIKGLSLDIEILQEKGREGADSADVARFTMQLNIMKDKKNRNLSSINEIIKNKE